MITGNIIKHGTKLSQLALFVLRKGGVYKQDLVMYANRLCSRPSDASTLVKELHDRGYLEVVDFNIKARRHTPAAPDKKSSAYYQNIKTVSVCYLSTDGLPEAYVLYEYIAKDKALPLDYFRALREPFVIETTEMSPNAYRETLSVYNANRIMTLFNMADIQSDPQRKPSLEEIYSYRNNTAYTPPADSPYRHYGSAEKLERALDSGFYYSIEEYRDLYAAHEDGKERFTSIARGLFISNSKCIVIYSNGKNNNSMLYCPVQSGETRMVQALKNENLAVDIYEYDDKGNVVVDEKGYAFVVAQRVDALAISDANYFIYSTAAGKKFGRTTAMHKNDNYLSKLLTPHSNVFADIDTDPRKVLDSYSRFYCVVYNKDGVTMLKSILEDSYDDTAAFYSTLIRSSKEKNKGRAKNDRLYPIFEKNTADSTLPLIYRPDEDNYYPCCRIEAYELLLLNKISKMDQTPAIITRKSLTNIIQHITLKKHIFLDADTLEPFGEDDTLAFDENGFPKGKKILEDYLHSNGLTASLKEYYELPKKFNRDYISFYNALAEEEISPEDCAKKMETRPYTPGRKYKASKKTVCISEELYDQIKELSSANSVTIYHTVNKLIRKALTASQD